MLVSRGVKEHPPEGRPDHPPRRCRSHHEAEQAAEGLPTEVLSEDRPPEDDRAAIAEGKDDEEDDHHPRNFHIAEEKEPQAQEAEGGDHDDSLVKEVRQPAESAPPEK